MSDVTQQLKAKYGRNKKGREAYNAAVRAELVGGDDLLDALELVDRLAHRLGERNLPGLAEAERARAALVECKAVMHAVITDRYSQR